MARIPRRRALALATLSLPAWLPAWLPAALAAPPAPPAPPAPLATVAVEAAAPPAAHPVEGIVQAVRQSVIAAQVAGRVTALEVAAGASVRAGQVLVRLDAAAIEQQLAAARAMRDAARSEYERSQRLHAREYLSAAAMERAEAQYRASTAQADAVLAQADWHVLRAPYAGRVSAVSIERGDLATPGRPLLTIHEPGALRVAAQLPESLLARLRAGEAARIELPGAPDDRRTVVARALTVLPAADPLSHSVEVRAELPAGTKALPGQFARMILPIADAGPARLAVPRSAVVVRGEMTGVYVVDGEGRSRLRQVRLGKPAGDRVEVLAGLAAGERVALDPVAAAAPAAAGGSATRR